MQESVSKQWEPDLPVRDRRQREGKKEKRDNEQVNVKRQKTQRRIKREMVNKRGRDG